MSAHTRILDHQWRVRGLDSPVELRLDATVSAIARVKEASLHGAFIETGMPLTLDASVAVRPIPESGVWIQARVLGAGNGGVALQWVDPRLDDLAILLTEKTR